jgi:DNA-binding XRE family transcriptional regulator
MCHGRSLEAIPVPVARALRKLGHDIRDARRRRRIPVTILAERASISRTTLHKAEKGDPGVSLGTYATVLFTLGMVDRLADVADPDLRWKRRTCPNAFGFLAGRRQVRQAPRVQSQ